MFRDPTTGDWLTATPPGQAILPIDVEDVARTTEQDAARFSERSPDDHGRVVRHRYVLGNAWRIAGTRIPTSAIWHFHEDRSDVDAIKQAYPDLTEQDIAAAIEHEQRLRAERAA